MSEPGTGLDALTAAMQEGAASTVRVCFGDHYGTLRGRRLPVEHFLSSPHARQAFCDGALVWDVSCDIFESTDYSNFRTGYPDLYAAPELATLRPCGWSAGEWSLFGAVVDHHGAPVLVDPRQALIAVLERLPSVPRVSAVLDLHVGELEDWQPGAPTAWGAELARGLTASFVDGIVLQPDPDRGLVRIMVTERGPLALADTLALVRTAARELGPACDTDVRAMPRTAPGQEPAELVLRIAGASPSAGALERLRELSLLLAPLPLAYPRQDARDALTVGASSDANPWLALAAALAATAEQEDPGDVPSPTRYHAAIEALRVSCWADRWFDPLLIHDTLALGERELALRDAQVSAWDLDRYGAIG